jgi:tetratricopeptide (TPR) repeat protein
MSRQDVTSILSSLTFTELARHIEKLLENKDFACADDLINEALRYRPNNKDLINAKGALFSAQGHHEKAVYQYNLALVDNPKPGGAWNNLGAAFKAMKLYDAAIICYQNAIRAGGESSLFLHNIALCLAESGRHAEAVTAFSRAIDLADDQPIIRWGRARSYLHLGNYEKGWADYEARLLSGQVPDRGLKAARWTGQPYAGKRLLLLAEQGFGDTIWAARYFPEVKALGGELIIECQLKNSQAISSPLATRSRKSIIFIISVAFRACSINLLGGFGGVLIWKRPIGDAGDFEG